MRVEHVGELGAAPNILRAGARERGSREPLVDLRHRLEELGCETRRFLGGRDLAHFADVAVRLGRRDRQPALDGPHELGRRGTEVGEHVLEDAVRVCGEQRLGKQRRRALVDGGGAHLHRGRRADLGPDDDPVHALERQLGDLGRARAGEVDARRASRPRRRAGDRPVHELESGVRDPTNGRRRDRVQLDEEACTANCRRDVLGGLGRHHREHDVGFRDDRAEIGEELERCRAASRDVRSLRPSRVATTRTPPRASASPSALPIAPGLTMPTVVTPTCRAATVSAPTSTPARPRPHAPRRPR